MPRLSLIVATYNRAEQLLTTLRSVAAQTAPAAEWECVVVDNNSTDDTAARFEEFLSAHPGLPLRRVSETRQGLSWARNRGIAETTGEIVAIIDDDERIVPEFIAAYIAFFDAHPSVASAGGPIVEPTAENIIVTPICAHALHAKSLVLDRSRVVRVKIGRLSRKSAHLSVDGGRAFKLCSSDVVEVRRSKCVTQVVRLTQRSFYEIINQKLTIVKNYMQTAWNIDMDELRDVVQRRMSDVVTGEIDLETLK